MPQQKDKPAQQTRWQFSIPSAFNALCRDTVCLVDGWELIAILPCPACGSGRLVWAEDGNVPGWRVCDNCGREWMAYPRGETVVVEIPSLESGLAWQPPDIYEKGWEWTGDGADRDRAAMYRRRRR